MKTDDPLDSLALQSLDQIAAATAGLLDVPLVLITTFEGTRQSYVGSHGLAKMRANELSPLCREVAKAGRPIMMQDARRRLSKAVRDVWGFELVAYAGVALTLLDPSSTGALAVLAPTRRAWQSEDVHVLRCFADAAAAVLNMRATCEELVPTTRRTTRRDVRG